MTGSRSRDTIAALSFSSYWAPWGALGSCGTEPADRAALQRDNGLCVRCRNRRGAAPLLDVAPAIKVFDGARQG
jgi:hypothetical protein